MKIKVDNIIYDSKKEPVMVILIEKDKENISNMSQDATKYCSYPDTYSKEEIESFMRIG